LGITSYRKRGSSIPRNIGLARRSPAIGLELIERAVDIGDNAFSVNSVDSLLYKALTTGRRCSCLDYKSSDGSQYAMDTTIQSPVLLLDDPDSDDVVEEALQDVLEMLGDPEEICPICFGTGIVNGYSLTNTHEIFMDVTYPNMTKHAVVISQGRPSYFKPIAQDAYIEFSINVPSMFLSVLITIITKEAGEHSTISNSLLQIKKAGDPAYENFTDSTLATMALASSSLVLKVFVQEEIHGIFLRVTLGNTHLKVNFPKISLTIDDGSYDYWDTQSVTVPSTYPLATKDVLRDTRYNRVWRVSSIELNEPREIDIGKDITLRRVRAWEAHKKLP
jgi:hypothetical protein